MRRTASVAIFLRKLSINLPVSPAQHETWGIFASRERRTEFYTGLARNQARQRQVVVDLQEEGSWLPLAGSYEWQPITVLLGASSHESREYGVLQRRQQAFTEATFVV
jgi:hypothetical protein